MTEITVVTPTISGRGQFLGEAIESVNAQTLRPVAHLISVDYDHVGPATHLNRLISNAETDWIAVLPDDDMLDPDHLESLAAVTGDLIYSWSRIIGKDVEQYRGDFSPKRLFNRQDTGIRAVFLMKKELWEEVGGYQDVLSDDWQFLCDCWNLGATFRLVPRETWTYRFHPKNLSTIIGQMIEGETPEETYYLKRFMEGATIGSA